MKRFTLAIGILLLAASGAFAQCWTPAWSASSSDTMIFTIQLATIDGTNMKSGDQIAIFDGAVCVGAGTLANTLSAANPLVITTLVDNSGTPEVDGYTAGNTITYRFCDSGSPEGETVTSTVLYGSATFAATTARDSTVVELRAVNAAPSFTSTAITSATQGSGYSYTPTATDPDGDALTWSAPVLPTSGWLTFNTGTHVLSGTPTNDDVGDNNVTIRINDGMVNVDQVFVISVANINDPPTFTSTPITTGTQGDAYSYTATAMDPDGDGLTWSAPVLPASGWLTFNTGTHVLSGTPGSGDVGDNSVTLRINDGSGDVDQVFTISVANINDAPVFTSTPITTGTQGTAYSYTATATDADGDGLTWSAPVLPASGWLTFNTGTHVLSGTPTNDDVGDNNVTIRINDGSGNVDQVFVIAVANINDPPTFTSTPITNGTQGTAYSYTATALEIDAEDVLTWSAPVLPVSGWLTFNATTHILSGTPGSGDVGNNSVTLRINDGTVDVDQSFTISVANINDAPVFTSTPITTATQGTAYSYTATAEDVDGDALTWSAQVLPAWLNFNTGTHILSGTPGSGDVGDHNVTLRVTDGTVNTDQAFVISVANINDAPVFTTTPITAATQGVAYSYTAAATDVDGDALTWSAPVLPAWLTFDIATHLLSGTPTNDNVGDHNVTLRVNDGTVNTDQVFVISVANVNDPPTFTSTPITTGTQGSIYTYTATAVDIDGNALTWSAPVLPAWLTFNTSTHILSGTPANENVGDNTVTLRVNDGTVDVDQTFVIQVADINDPPVFTSTPVTAVLQGAAYNYTATATDADGNTLTWSAPVLPSWLTFNTSSHLLTGIPGNEHVGNHPVTLRVNDGTVDVDQIFTIVVANENDPPTFTSTPVTSVLQGAAYNYTATATDLDGNALTFMAPVLPAWLTFNASTHVLSGIPANENVGNNNVTLQVTDGIDTTDQIFVIQVINVNDPPTFTSTPITLATQGVAYNYTATAEDVDGNALTWSAPVLPAWLAFNATTHILSGTPGNEHVGDHPVTLRINDGSVDVDQSFVISVGDTNDPPVFTSTPITVATQGALYSYTATATDPDGNTLTFSAPVLPAWLTFDVATHVLSGTPANEHVGNHSVTLRIFDGAVNVDQSFVIAVSNVNDAPTFTSTPITTATQGVLYSYTATAEDLDGNTLTFSAPLLPTWLTFDVATHVLSGTPGNGNVGNNAVTLRVSDGTASTDQSFTIVVGDTNDPPSFTSTPVTVATQGTQYSYTATAMDPDGNALTWSAPVLPAWLNFNTTTHILSGTPDGTQVGDHPVTLRINDGTVDVDQSFVIAVANINDAPTFTSTPNPTAHVGLPYTYTATAIDVDGDPITYSAPLLPGWLSFNSTTHTLSATPGYAQLGNHNVTLRVSDGSLATDQSFVLSVIEDNSAPGFTSDPATTAEVGTAYIYTMTAVDPDGDALTFSAPSIPAWLTFYDATNVISGTPGMGDIGQYTITLRVSDGHLTADQTYYLTVVKGNDPPAFTSSPVTTIVEGAYYEYVAIAEDVDGDALTYSAPTKPIWTTFNISTHTLSGTPGSQDAGNYGVTLRVSDGTATVDQNFTITVEKGTGIGDENVPRMMLIYPNPTDGRFFVELNRTFEEAVTLEMIDATGRMFLQKEIPPHQLLLEELDLSSEPAGIYFIRIKHSTGLVLGKVIIR